MTYLIKNKEITNKYFVGLKLDSNTNVQANNPVPYTIYEGTSGHGVTVSNGVISLPSGEFLIEFSVLAEYNVDFEAKIYKDSAEVVDAPNIFQYVSDLEYTSTLISTYPTKGNCDIELRVVSDVSPMSIYSDVLIIRII